MEPLLPPLPLLLLVELLLPLLQLLCLMDELSILLVDDPLSLLLFEVLLSPINCPQLQRQGCYRGARET